MKWHIPLCYGITIYLVNVVKSKLFFNEDEYDHVYRLEHSCSYETIYQNQYQKTLVKWDGEGFFVWCTRTFQGRNDENVVTDYTVCFNVLDYHIDCKVNVQYRYLELGFDDDIRGSYSCGDTIPKQWCVNRQATLRIQTDEDTSSYLRLEVTVKAGTNLSITACLLIVAAIAGLIITISIILVWKCRKGKGSEGRVIRESTDPARAGMPLVGYPTTVMEPVGRGMYVPRTAAIQVQSQNMATQQVTPSTTRSVTPTAPPSDMSAPPPSYEDCT